MLLSRLIRGIALTDQIGRDVEITSLTCDGERVSPAASLPPSRGEKTDGTQFIQEALDRGAAAVLCAQPPDRPGPWLLTSDPRGAFGQMAANWFGRPGERMTLVGVTGTNGKTTTTYLLKGVLEAVCQTKVGLIGTNRNLIGQQALPAQRTTPDAYTLQSLLARMEEAGCTHVVMEVSSHALALRRTAGLCVPGGDVHQPHPGPLWIFTGPWRPIARPRACCSSSVRRAFLTWTTGQGRQFARQRPARR